jgi:proline dehydrogenase
VVARTYDYASEVQCERHVATFLKAIATASKLPGQGFAALKMTALGSPPLLERMSCSLLEIQGLFRLCDVDGSGTVSLEEYQQVMLLFWWWWWWWGRGGYEARKEGEGGDLKAVMTRDGWG